MHFPILLGTVHGSKLDFEQKILVVNMRPHRFKTEGRLLEQDGALSVTEQTPTLPEALCMTKTKNKHSKSAADSGGTDTLQNNAKILNKTSMPLLGGKHIAQVFTFQGLSDSKEHLALAFGLELSDAENFKTPPPGTLAPLVRLHSECLTGDVFGSAKCDCGPQLHESIEKCATQGGIVLYLRQEGRGIGLYNKISAYALQEQGLDTFEANHALSFPDDLRSYRVAAEMLHALGIKAVRLLTNNPNKSAELRSYGIAVESTVATGIFANSYNYRYLKSKVTKSGHKIAMEDIEKAATKVLGSTLKNEGG